MGSDFVVDRGTSQEHRWMCMMCTEPVFADKIEATAFTKTSTVHRMYYWLQRLDRFWGKYPLLDKLFTGSYVFFLSLAVVSAVMPELQDYVTVPFTLFAIFYAVANFVPLSSFPAGTINAVTNLENKYKGCGRACMSLVALTIVVSFALELLYSVVAPSGSDNSKINGQADRIIKRTASSLLVSVPVLMIVYLNVSNMYTEIDPAMPIDPSWTDGHTTNIDRVKRFVHSMPGDTYQARRMKRMWMKRGGYFEYS